MYRGGSISPHSRTLWGPMGGRLSGVVQPQYAGYYGHPKVMGPPRYAKMAAFMGRLGWL